MINGFDIELSLRFFEKTHRKWSIGKEYDNNESIPWLELHLELGVVGFYIFFKRIKFDMRG